ncbi:MAG: hypothetical protein AAGG02_06255 [Cyanobacteria bacterium P01_H01_bin.15]
MTWNPNKPSNGGCRGVEFDIWRHSSPFVNMRSISEGFFTVNHSSPSSGKSLKYYLDQLIAWYKKADKVGGPVLVTLDIKSSNGDIAEFPNEIDTYLKCYFRSSLIYKPQDLYTDRNQHGSICERVIRGGWPVPKNETYFIFCLSGTPAWKYFYAAQDPLSRLCFSDFDRPDNDPSVSPPEQGNFVFFNFNIHNSNRNIWMKTIPPFARKNLIVRAYVANSNENFSNCKTAGVSAIATDKISNHSWADVSDINPYAPRAI